MTFRKKEHFQIARFKKLNECTAVKQKWQVDQHCTWYLDNLHIQSKKNAFFNNIKRFKTLYLFNTVLWGERLMWFTCTVLQDSHFLLLHLFILTTSILILILVAYYFNYVCFCCCAVFVRSHISVVTVYIWWMRRLRFLSEIMQRQTPLSCWLYSSILIKTLVSFRCLPFSSSTKLFLYQITMTDQTNNAGASLLPTGLKCRSGNAKLTRTQVVVWMEPCVRRYDWGKYCSCQHGHGHRHGHGKYVCVFIWTD